uniref:Uncharacterized protein n=1 Tax=Anguilla anguilla TaxID=7936 RepID=A0A0E9W666_ANGAN
MPIILYISEATSSLTGRFIFRDAVHCVKCCRALGRGTLGAVKSRGRDVRSLFTACQSISKLSLPPVPLQKDYPAIFF